MRDLTHIYIQALQKSVNMHSMPPVGNDPAVRALAESESALVKLAYCLLVEYDRAIGG